MLICTYLNVSVSCIFSPQIFFHSQVCVVKTMLHKSVMGKGLLYAKHMKKERERECVCVCARASDIYQVSFY